MNLFDPRTYSVEWEIPVVDKLERCVGSEKLMGFAGILSNELDLPIHEDWNSLELAMGINTSMEQLWERIRRATDRTAQVLREYELELFPSGAHPADHQFNSAHVHVGTIHDEAAAIRLENRMMKYAPVFAALAANSPAWRGFRGEFKSYRIQRMAYGCVRPSESRDPEMSQPTWGNDAAPRIDGAPTMEIRIPDGASSRRLLAEFVTFIAAYVHHRGTELENYRPTAREYREYLTNRWAAARFGMQATFMWDDKSRPVAELIDEMLDECADELKALGATRANLGIVNEMVEKRVCQADFAMSLLDRYPDRLCFASAYGKLVRQWDIFEEYLQSAAALDPVPALDKEAVIAEHLEFVGEGTYFYNLREVMFYPATVTEEIIEQLIDRKLVRREVHPESGMLLHRVE